MREIFMSYSWNDKDVVDHLDNLFKNKGILLKRDIREISYLQDITEFMKQVRTADYCLMMISDSYLKSFNCMREMLELIKDENYKDKVIPVIIGDTKIFTSENRSEYTLYWQEQYNIKDSQREKLENLNQIDALEELRIVEEIKRNISTFLKRLSRVNLILTRGKACVLRKDFDKIYNEVSQKHKVNGKSENFQSISKNIQKYIDSQLVSNDIRESVYQVLNDAEYPRWMSISGSKVKNPVWENKSNQAIKSTIGKYCINGPSAPLVKHLDMLLIRRNDHQGHGQILTYYSDTWQTNLITFRYVTPEDNPDCRKEANSVHLACFIPVPASSILVTPLTERYAVSVKKDKHTGDIKLYIYEFWSVVFNETPSFWANEQPETNFNSASASETHWFYFRELREDKKYCSVNGDVISAIQEWFGPTLGSLPNSLQDAIDKNGVV
jgi:hypothetical protein